LYTINYIRAETNQTEPNWTEQNRTDKDK